MNTPDLARIDTLEVNFYSQEYPLASSDETLDEILEIVERHAGELIPAQVYAGARRSKYTRASVKKQFAHRNATDTSWTFWLLKKDKPESRAHFLF